MYIPQEADEDEYETSDDEEPEHDHRYQNADNYEQEYYGTSESE